MHETARQQRPTPGSHHGFPDVTPGTEAGDRTTRHTSSYDRHHRWYVAPHGTTLVQTSAL
jgi:hypothetical protein